MNKVLVLGNLGGDPELRHTEKGDAVCTFTVASNETWVDAQGEKQERVEWHRCVAWKKRGEAIAKFFKKGSKILVEGKLQTRKWQDKEGADRWTTEIIVMGFFFTERKGEGGSAAPPTPPPAGGDDIPF